MPPKKQSFQFEKALNELENIVHEMEAGDLTLEKALTNFEQGIGLIRGCQQQLKTAEQKVMQLVSKDDAFTLEPFTPPESDEAH